jgi:hypothetical protein
MPVQSALQLIEQAALEAMLASPSEFKPINDRILVMFDVARNKLSPVSERARSHRLHTQATEAQVAATCAVAQTILPRQALEEPFAYVYLKDLGKTVTQAQLVDILQKTAVRLRSSEHAPAS